MPCYPSATTCGPCGSSAPFSIGIYDTGITGGNLSPVRQNPYQSARYPPPVQTEASGVARQIGNVAAAIREGRLRTMADFSSFVWAVGVIPGTLSDYFTQQVQLRGLPLQQLQVSLSRIEAKFRAGMLREPLDVLREVF